MVGDNDKLFCLDMATLKWEVVRTRSGETPASRDEHTAVISESD